MASFGVAVLSQVYLFHMNTALPSSLATSRAAADQFIASGEGASHLIIEGVILQGFKLTALTCLVLCGSAAVLAFFIRKRLGKRGITYPVQMEPTSVTSVLYPPTERVYKKSMPEEKKEV